MRRADAKLISTVRQRAPGQYNKLPPCLKLAALADEAEGRAVEVLNGSGNKDAHARARVKTLAARSRTDLNLLHDIGLSSGIPFSQLARVKRARFEMNKLLAELENTQ